VSEPLPSGSGAAGGGGIALEELIALNDEIVALVRAGVPLERGLIDAGGDLRGRLGAIATALGQRMGRGEGLLGALEAEGDRIPRVYRAMVEAGLRTGRLAAALEGLARFARSYAELRRVIGLALVYPVVVLVVAYAMFVGFVVAIAPRFVTAIRSFQMPERGPAFALAWLGQTAAYWGPIGPVVLLLLAAWWVRSGRASLLEPRWAGGMLGWVPGMGRMIANTKAANFAELLALLIEHRVPFAQAVELAADATGDSAMRRAAAGVAAATRRGDSLPDSVRGSHLFPPLLNWMVVAGQQQGTLVAALRNAAQIYRRRAVYQADLIRVFLPTTLVLLVGATATLLYALTLFLPFSNLLYHLSEG
jgi:type II secretory pathway component PulF